AQGSRPHQPVADGRGGERHGAEQAQHRGAPAGVVRDAERVPRLSVPRPLPRRLRIVGEDEAHAAREDPRQDPLPGRRRVPVAPSCPIIRDGPHLFPEETPWPRLTGSPAIARFPTLTRSPLTPSSPDRRSRPPAAASSCAAIPPRPTSTASASAPWSPSGKAWLRRSPRTTAPAIRRR